MGGFCGIRSGVGAGVLGVEVLLEVEGVLLDVDDELEPPVFDFLSRESLR
jgi:hypothetical protein